MWEWTWEYLRAEKPSPHQDGGRPSHTVQQWHARHRVQLPGAAAGRCTVDDPVGAAMATALAQRSFRALRARLPQPFSAPAPADDTAGCRECSRHACWACRFRQSIAERNCSQAPGPWPHSWFRNAICEQQSKSLATAFQRISTYDLAQTNPAPFRTRSFGLLRAGGRLCINGQPR